MILEGEKKTPNQEMKKMKGVKMHEMDREAAERSVRIEADYCAWPQQVVDREMSLITARWESARWPNDLLCDAVIMERVGMGADDSWMLRDLENAAAAFRAVFAE